VVVKFVVANNVKQRHKGTAQSTGRNSSTAAPQQRRTDKPTNRQTDEPTKSKNAPQRRSTGEEQQRKATVEIATIVEINMTIIKYPR